MGLEIEKTEFTAEDFRKFSELLRTNLQALESMLARPGFGAGDLSFGAELELYIVDGEGRPRHIHPALIRQLADRLLPLEVNRYNPESNFSPYRLKDK